MTIAVHAPAFVQSDVAGMPNHLTWTDQFGQVWTIGYASAGSQVVALLQSGGDLLTGQVDLLGMMNYLAANTSLFTTSWYFNGVGFGAEPQQGSGTLTVNSYALTFNYLLRRDLPGASANDNRPVGLEAAA